MSQRKRIAPAGDWVSPISMEDVFAQPSAPSYPFHHQGELFYQQALAAEGGRNALMKWEHGESTCLTPAPFNLRSQVHEYGGKCFCVCGNQLVFNNFQDGQLYRVNLDGAEQPQRVDPPDDDIVGYADLVHWVSPHTASSWIIAICERRNENQFNDNMIVAISLDDGSATTLCEGADFYASPAVHVERLGWIQWQLPDMPWDRAALCTGKLVEREGSIACEEIESLIDDDQRAVSQVGFANDGSLLFAADSPARDWWNLFQFDADVDAAGRPVTNLQAEVGAAHWVFGQRRWVEIIEGDSCAVLCIATSAEGDQLVRVDDLDPKSATVLLRDASISHLMPAANPGKVLAVVSPEDRPGYIAEIDCASGAAHSIGPDSVPLLKQGYSVPRAVRCETRDGELTHGYYYPPYNPEYCLAQDTLPPLVVMVHGGPTSRSDPSFHPLRQYFASLGFAILDVNHRGSTGHGRRYRQRLRGGWGEIDAMDIADLTRAMVQEGEADPDMLFIRGGSAGGYAVLRALTRDADLFAGGACYYGIGNLITLSEITHKFEGKYTDGLVGEPFDSESSRLPDSRYRDRSPIFEMDRLRSPLILFQGLKDKVVPPEVTREVVALLEKEGIPHQYVEYSDEGHGFRALETRVDSLQRETCFFRELID